MNSKSKKRYKTDFNRAWPNLSGCLPFVLAILGTAGLALMLIREKPQESNCLNNRLSFIENTPIEISSDNHLNCYSLPLKQGQILSIETTQKVKLFDPDKNLQIIQSKEGYKQEILKSGDHIITFDNLNKSSSYLARIKITAPDQNLSLSHLESQVKENTYLPPPPPPPPSSHTPLTPALEPLSSYVYNVTILPPFSPNKELQTIVNNVVNLADSRKLPIEKISISLVDLTSPICCDYASYNDQELRYPASIIKLFWLVKLYSQYHSQGMTPEQINADAQVMISKTIKKSDNETASKMLDTITQTQSEPKELLLEKLIPWISKRYSVNEFYRLAGYPEFNISQKVFPISNEITKPLGPDLQIRQIQGKDSPPIRNFVSTYSVARLLYEIQQEQAISVEYSEATKQLLKRDLNPQMWKKEPFNPIAGFLGESLPIKTKFYAKMGWTFSNRNDAAIIVSSDRKSKYILVVFGDDAAYYKDKQFFPLISKEIYQKMNNY